MPHALLCMLFGSARGCYDSALQNLFPPPVRRIYTSDIRERMCSLISHTALCVPTPRTFHACISCMPKRHVRTHVPPNVSSMPRVEYHSTPVDHVYTAYTAPELPCSRRSWLCLTTRHHLDLRVARGTSRPAHMPTRTSPQVVNRASLSTPRIPPMRNHTHQSSMTSLYISSSPWIHCIHCP